MARNLAIEIEGDPLQPERINAYAQAVIRTLQADEHQRGCLMEERVFAGPGPGQLARNRLRKIMMGQTPPCRLNRALPQPVSFSIGYLSGSHYDGFSVRYSMEMAVFE